MLNYEKYAMQQGYTLEKVLSSKEDSACLLMKRSDNSLCILRVYPQEIPAYIDMTGHSCAFFPKIYSCTAQDDMFFVVEEYIEGISVDTLLEQGETLSEEQAKTIILAVCQAVSELHRVGYIHRDIKPEHVLITNDKRIKLVDLGASMKIVPEKGNDTVLLGTVGYAAPEQFGFSRSDVRTDIFAVGILLNELLTGVHPSVKLYNGQPFRGLINKSIQMNPADRYQSIQEQQNAIESETLAKPEKKNKGLLIGGIVALLVVLVAAFILVPQPLDNSTENTPDDPTASIDGSADDTPDGIVEGTSYLQLYKDRIETTYRHYRQGRQCAPLYTKSGEKIDKTYKVYADESIGYVEWAEEYDSWGLISETCMPGDTGLLHAEKDGKHYAIRCLIFAEPVSIYTQPPDIFDLTKNYLKAENPDGRKTIGLFDLTYTKGKPVTLYVVAAPGYVLKDTECDSADVALMPYTEAKSYPYPIKTLTFTGHGGDQTFTLTSPENTYTFRMREAK